MTGEKWGERRKTSRISSAVAGAFTGRKKKIGCGTKNFVKGEGMSNNKSLSVEKVQGGKTSPRV